MSECTSAENTLAYNYLIFCPQDDYLMAALHDLSLLPQVHFQDRGLGSGGKLRKSLFRLHWSGKINQKLRLPGKRVWFKAMCSYDFHNDKPTCYVFLGGQYIAGEPALRDYIKKNNPHDKIVIAYADLIEKKHYKDFSAVRRSADAVITYDPSDAKKYGILAYSDHKIYSRILALSEPEHFDYDVFFIGYAKNRLSTIMEVYHVLTDAGLRCRFDLVGVPADQQEKLSGISYCAAIPYKESLNRLCKAKCVLEILQNGATGSTLRHAEAIAYHRLLLTNSPTLEGSQNYIPQTMSAFRSPAEIDVAFLRRPIDYASFHNTSIEDSPIHFLEFIDENL